ncbi:CdaR family protein [Aminirod propionatiphilus]|uniref:Uncharacterized protein n=1 Tax=Aminirod propionatiphilus TaxID=3415223 RepID=A0ACD1DSI3_9BACT|nr:hypothetical protein KIH16_07615 [Synergistota bacterium]
MKFNRLDKMLASSLFLKGLSLVVAFFLWFYVSSEVGGESVREYLVPIEYRNVPAGLELKADPKEVRIQAMAGNSFFSFFEESAIRAEVDLGGLEAGRYRLNVRALLPSEMRLVSLSHSLAEVNLTRIVERVLPLKAEVKGGLPPGLLLEAVEMTPSEITVRGPEEVISGLKSARLEPQIDQLRLGKPVELAVVLPDLPQNRRSSVSVTPEKAFLSAKVLEGLPTRKLAVRARLVGEANRDYSLAGLIVEPAEVPVQGPLAHLDALAEVTTEAIDLSEMVQGTTLVVPLAALPEGLNYAAERAVQVQILFENRTTTRLYASLPVKTIGRSVYPGWRVEPEVIDVVVEGIPSQLDALASEGKAPEVVVDVTNIVSKKLTVPVQVKLPLSGIRLVRTEPTEVTVYALLD